MSMPSSATNFEGVGNVNGVIPPDANGAAGPSHYVQWVNLSFAVWDRAGHLVYGPAAGTTLWTGFGAPCETVNGGDPIVLYDHLAGRWFLSQLAAPNFPNGPFYQCIAVSTTSDPTGTFYRYAFLFSQTKLNDYPKFGIWPDAYYMAANQFNAGSLTWAGQGAVAFEREKMLDGQPARQIVLDLSTVDGTLGLMLPSHLEGPPPPAGTPNYYAQFDDDAWGYAPSDQLQLWAFHVDWTTPEASTSLQPDTGGRDDTRVLLDLGRDGCCEMLGRVPDSRTAALGKELAHIGWTAGVDHCRIELVDDLCGGRRRNKEAVPEFRRVAISPRLGDSWKLRCGGRARCRCPPANKRLALRSFMGCQPLSNLRAYSARFFTSGCRLPSQPCPIVRSP